MLTSLLSEECNRFFTYRLCFVVFRFLIELIKIHDLFTLILTVPEFLLRKEKGRKKENNKTKYVKIFEKVRLSSIHLICQPCRFHRKPRRKNSYKFIFCKYYWIIPKSREQLKSSMSLHLAIIFVRVKFGNKILLNYKPDSTLH